MTVQFRPTMEREQIYELINVDLDARRYFFHKADERWLEWLWRNGFLDAIKEENAEPLCVTRTPELEYLLRMAEKRPDSVVDVMLDTPISTDTQEPGGRLRLLTDLQFPSLQISLARVVDKFRDERWIPLIDAIYRPFSFRTARRCLRLSLTQTTSRVSWRSLRQCWLCAQAKNLQMGVSSKTIHSTWSISRVPAFSPNWPLCKPKYAEGALALAIRKLSDVLAISNEFGFFEVDFFTLQLGQADTLQDSEVRELAAVVKTLAVRLIGKRCDDAQTARDIYGRHFASLPANRVMRRLTLLCFEPVPGGIQGRPQTGLFLPVRGRKLLRRVVRDRV